MAPHSLASSGPLTSIGVQLALRLGCQPPQPSMAHLTASAPFRARHLPVSGRLSTAPAPEGDGALAVVSRCLSAAGLGFSVILARLVFRPSYDRPTGAAAPDHDGVSVFRTCEIRPEWAPSLPRDRRCSRGPAAISGRRLPLPSGQVLSPGHPRHQPRVMPHEASDEGSSLRPPGLPLTRDPRMARASLGFPPGLRTPADRTRGRTPGRGQALSTGLEHRRQRQVMTPALRSARFTRIMCDLASHLQASVRPPWS